MTQRRKHKSNAEKQRAYRQRKRNANLAAVRGATSSGPGKPAAAGSTRRAAQARKDQTGAGRAGPPLVVYPAKS